MREEIKNFEGYFWGLQKDDLTLTADLTKAYFAAYYNSIKLPNEKVLTPEIELYLNSHFRESQFIYHFGIWRLQAIFETLLKNRFNINTRKGFKHIVTLLKERGFYIVEETELQLWTNLRNHLSHSAPERFHPAASNLVESDIDEFTALLLRVYDNLEIQKKNNDIL